MKKIIISLFASLSLYSQGQNCDPTVPSLNVDLTGQPNGTWVSPMVIRNGACCSSSPRCIEFIITLDPQAQGISFSITSGAIPPGALTYQINCSGAYPVGSAICLNGVGPHVITFCKPGNNLNQYTIQSIAAPQPIPNATVSAGCSINLATQGLNPSTISWNSIFPGAPGTYNSYLNCLNCSAVTVTPGIGAPVFIDYQVCGMVASGCSTIPYCDTIRVSIVPMLININQTNVTCNGYCNGSIDVSPSSGVPPFMYSWTTGQNGSTLGTLCAGTYTVTITDANGCAITTDVTITQPPSIIIGPVSHN